MLLLVLVAYPLLSTNDEISVVLEEQILCHKAIFTLSCKALQQISNHGSPHNVKIVDFIADLQCKPQQRYCLLRDCWRPRRYSVLCRPQRLLQSPVCAGHHPYWSVCQESWAAHGLRKTTWGRRWITILVTFTCYASNITCMLCPKQLAIRLQCNRNSNCIAVELIQCFKKSDTH